MTSILFEHFFAHVMPVVEPSTQVAYRAMAKSFIERFANVHPRDIHSPDIGEWMIAEANARVRGRRMRSKLEFIKRFFAWCADNGEIHEDHMVIFLRRRLPRVKFNRVSRRPITQSEHFAIMREARSGRTKYWWTTACTIGWHTGLRMNDVAFLEWSHIDFEKELIQLTPIKTKRFGKVVTIPMEAELSEHLVVLKERPYYDSTYVIPDMAGYYRMDRTYLPLTFKALSERCRIKEVSFHSYRHAFVSRLINAGVHPLIIGSMTGQSERQIKDYTHVSPEAQREAMAKAMQQLHNERLRRDGILSETKPNT